MYVVDTERILSCQSRGSSHGIAAMGSNDLLVGLEATRPMNRQQNGKSGSSGNFRPTLRQSCQSRLSRVYAARQTFFVKGSLHVFR